MRLPFNDTDRCVVYSLVAIGVCGERVTSSFFHIPGVYEIGLATAPPFLQGSGWERFLN